MNKVNYRNVQQSRCGFATILVILAILALSLTIYSFADQSFLEHASTRASIRQTQSRLTALSGIEWIRSRLSQEDESLRKEAIRPISKRNHNELHDATVFKEFDSNIYRKLTSTNDVSQKDLRLGLFSESAKLNIHSLDLTKKGESISRARLCALPNMTPQMADALLDWIDQDDIARTFGAEAEWYSQNSTKFRPSNQPIREWRELIFVRGFSEQVLFGEDTNLNGWLDWNENDKDSKLPIDNGDGKLDEGLARFLSLNAYEWNNDRFGQRKIDLNDENLPRFFDNVSKVFGEEAAVFVSALRMDGPIRNDASFDKSSTLKSIRNSVEERMDLQLTPSNTRSGSSLDSKILVQKGGLSLNRRPVHRIRSVIDLIDVSVLTVINNEEKQLESPWKIGSSDNHKLIVDLENVFTTSPSEELIGRIDITQAPLEVLGTVPGFSRSAAMALIELRDQQEKNENDSIRSIYWLVENQILDFELLRNVAPFLTTKGAIYTGYSVGRDFVSQSAAIARFTLSQEGKSVRLLEYCEVGMTPWIRNDVHYDRARSP